MKGTGEKELPVHERSMCLKCRSLGQQHGHDGKQKQPNGRIFFQPQCCVFFCALECPRHSVILSCGFFFIGRTPSLCLPIPGELHEHVHDGKAQSDSSRLAAWAGTVFP